MSDRLAKKVLLVGWDAADWVILQPLLDQGKMPVLAGLIQRGTSGKISTLWPILSPMLWNSIATGKRPDLHGIYGFVEPRPDGSGIRPVTSTSRTCKALWNILSQNDLRSIVVNWFASFPAEPVKGVVISDRYCAQSQIHPRQQRFGPAMIHPPDLVQSYAELVVPPPMLPPDVVLSFVPEAQEVDQEKDDRIRKLCGLIAKMTTIHAAACKAMLQERWDFMAVYYDAIDHFGHTFMPYHPPAMEGIDPQDAKVYGNCVTACYQFQDMMLGAMLRYAGEDTTVILVSDHGFHSEEHRPGVDGYKDPVSWHRPYGVVVAAGPGVQSGETLSGVSLVDVTPTILTLLGLPIGDDMDGRPWVEMMDPPPRVERIESWETVDGDDGMHPEEVREDPVAAAEAVKQLVDLGYVDAPDEDVDKQVANTMRSIKFHRALALSHSRRRDQAIPLWEQLVDETPDPNDKQGMKLNLATCLMRVGRFREAEAMLYSFGFQVLQSPVVQMMLATLRLQQERGDEALKHLQAAAAKLPEKTPQLVAQLGLAYLQTHQLVEAHEQFELALADDDENAIAYIGLAELNNRRGNFDQAVEHALRAVELVDAVPAAHYQLSVALSKLGMIDEAVVAAETFVQLSPTVPRGQRLLDELRERQHAAGRQAPQEVSSRRVSAPDADRIRRYTGNNE